MASHHPIRKSVAPDPPVIPDKLYFRIGDVAALCDIPAYVLRFWETEFPQLKPNKGGTGQRLYRKRDVEMALRIKSLLYDQGYTIPGARQVFKAEAQPAASELSSAAALQQPATQPQATQPQALAPAQPVDIVDIGAAIRADAPFRDRIDAIRAELRSLAELLATSPSIQLPAAAPEPTRLKLMRPRLVLETRSEVRTESRFSPRLVDQGDLFPAE